MTQLILKKYPVGIQTFSELITKGYLYIDKTEYVYRMTRVGSANRCLPVRFVLISKGGRICSKGLLSRS